MAKQKQENNHPLYSRYGDYPELQEDISRAKLFRVDPLKLDEEASIQGEIINFVGTNLARAKEKSAEAAAYVKEVKATVFLTIKEHAIGGKSPTVEELKNRVESHPDVLHAIALSLDKQRTMDFIEADYNAAQSKGRMIEFYKKEFERSLQYK